VEETKERRKGGLAGPPLQLLPSAARWLARETCTIPASSDSRNDEQRPTACLGKNYGEPTPSRFKENVGDGSSGGTFTLPQEGLPDPGQKSSRKTAASKNFGTFGDLYCSHHKGRCSLWPVGLAPSVALRSIMRSANPKKAPKLFAATEAQPPQRTQPLPSTGEVEQL
jgi:hypothetical protein